MRITRREAILAGASLGAFAAVAAPVASAATARVRPVAEPRRVSLLISTAFTRQHWAQGKHNWDDNQGAITAIESETLHIVVRNDTKEVRLVDIGGDHPAQRVRPGKVAEFVAEIGGRPFGVDARSATRMAYIPVKVTAPAPAG